MALTPITLPSSATNPVQSRGLFNTQGGRTYDDWLRRSTPGQAMPSIAPSQVDDSVINALNQVTSKDGAYMQAAKTEGLKIANSRGLLNSSMAAGATQDAALRYALPVASQEASQNFQRNAAARQFEYNMATQDAAQGWQSSENALNRQLEERMQNAAITAADRQQIRSIASTEGLAAAERALQLQMQTNSLAAADRQQIRAIASTEGIAAAERALQLALQREQQTFAGTQAALDRQLEMAMQQNAITAAEQQQIRNIASTEGLAAADRALRERLQTQQNQFASEQAGLDRELQERIATWNLTATDRNAAANFISNVESIYQNQFASIMANTALSAEDRTRYLTAARGLRDQQLNLVEQVYDIDLNWTRADGTPSNPPPPAPPGTTPTPAPAPAPAPLPAGSASGGIFGGILGGGRDR